LINKPISPPSSLYSAWIFAQNILSTKHVHCRCCGYLFCAFRLNSANNAKHIAWRFCAAQFIRKTNTSNCRRQNIIKRTNRARAEFCTKNQTNTHTNANAGAKEQSLAGFAYLHDYASASTAYSPLRWRFCVIVSMHGRRNFVLLIWDLECKKRQ
jgi:hypothetical protein